MCLDISFRIDDTVDSIYDYLPHLKVDPQLSIDYSTSVHIQAHARLKSRVIYLNSEGDPYLTEMRWGLITKFLLDDPEAMKKYGNNMFNARSEEVFNKKKVWYRVRHQRCLMDISGIYEHRKINGWKKKVPYHIRLKSRKRLLLPAFYNFPEKANPETGEITGTFAMVTRWANELMRYVHNDGENKHRMPLFMQPQQAIEWLNPKMTDAEMKAFMDYEIPSEELDACPVYQIRNLPVRPDGRDKDQPYEYAGLPPLGNDDPIITTELFG